MYKQMGNFAKGPLSKEFQYGYVQPEKSLMNGQLR